MTKFDELIDNLKRDIQSLPSADGRECVVVAPPVSVVDAPVVAAVPTTKGKWVGMFVRHGMLSAEFFFFFLILLSVSRPSFLYRNERVVRGGREMWRTNFSMTYLFAYSAFFTLAVHALILIQKDFAKRY